MTGFAAINQAILRGYLSCREQDFSRRSHFFHGRYENLYLDRNRIPAVAQVLDQAEYFAQVLLDRPRETLRSGFWINDMGPGEQTTEHNHDDLDELLSGVYYVQTPPDCGDLIIVEGKARTQITPQAGMFIFFLPTVTHAVGINRSGQRRISIGMNFGPHPG